MWVRDILEYLDLSEDIKMNIYNLCNALTETWDALQEAQSHMAQMKGSRLDAVVELVEESGPIQPELAFEGRVAEEYLSLYNVDGFPMCIYILSYS